MKKPKIGSALLLATILLFVVLSLVVSLSYVTVLEQRMSQKSKSSVGAFFNSDSGIEWALNKIANPTGANIDNNFTFDSTATGQINCPDFGNGSPCILYLLDKDGKIINDSNANSIQPSSLLSEVKAIRSVGSQNTGEATQRAIEAAVAAGCGWTSANGAVYLTNSTDKVGIGTNAPDVPLVVSTGGGAGNVLKLQSQASTSWNFYVDGSADNLYIKKSGNTNESWISLADDDSSYHSGFSSNGNARFDGSVTVGSCSGCSTFAEMMPVEGDVVEGEAMCIGDTGKISACQDDKSTKVVGIATQHAEQILRLGCANSGVGENHLQLGGDNKNWQNNPACQGWFPVALTGLHEFVKAECFRHDGSKMQIGDRVVTSNKNAGYVRPLSDSEDGGDAVVGKVIKGCDDGNSTGIIHVLLK